MQFQETGLNYIIYCKLVHIIKVLYMKSCIILPQIPCIFFDNSGDHLLEMDDVLLANSWCKDLPEHLNFQLLIKYFWVLQWHGDTVSWTPKYFLLDSGLRIMQGCANS